MIHCAYVSVVWCAGHVCNHIMVVHWPVPIDLMNHVLQPAPSVFHSFPFHFTVEYNSGFVASFERRHNTLTVLDHQMTMVSHYFLHSS